MKIQIELPEKNQILSIPDFMLSPKLIAFVAKIAGGAKADKALEEIPAEALERIFAQLRNIKKVHGSWEVVEIHSAQGKRIKIIL